MVVTETEHVRRAKAMGVVLLIAWNMIIALIYGTRGMV